MTTTGGAIFLNNFPGLTISNTIITNNRAESAGGGIYCNNSDLEVINTVIVNNNAVQGGGIYIANSSPTFMNNTISNNTAVTGGGLCIAADSSPAFTNTIIWGNASFGIGDQAALMASTANPVFSYCNVQSGVTGFAGTGVSEYGIALYLNSIDADPMYVNPAEGAGREFNGLIADWSLQSTSPCINAGVPGTGSDEAGMADVAGQSRFSGIAIDIGDFEFQE
ncbi:right-handed parallel beta-helix repeat-containing protein [Desulfobacterales bacterium HSG17]|nr:right-handed parallel beta-helix repeat-containing protein [Desulfobacterales bacterium HSG17]